MRRALPRRAPTARRRGRATPALAVVALFAACSKKDDRAAARAAPTDAAAPARGTPTLLLTEVDVYLFGKPIVPVRDGRVDPSEVKGGRIERLTFAARAAVAQTGDPGTLEVHIEPGATYELLAQAVASVSGTFRDIHLVLGEAAPPIPISVPSPEPVAAMDAGPAPADPPVGVALALSRKDARVWSMSGLEGTLREPRTSAPIGDVEAIRAGLADIVARRWSGGTPRPPDDRRILLVADGALDLEIVAAYLVAAHASFPEVTLGAGIE